MKDCCKNCPAYWNACDYWGEWDEGCLIYCDAWFNGKGYKLICHMPIFIKKIYLRLYRLIDDIRLEKHMREQEEAEELDNLDQSLEE